DHEDTQLVDVPGEGRHRTLDASVGARDAHRQTAVLAQVEQAAADEAVQVVDLLPLLGAEGDVDARWGRAVADVAPGDDPPAKDDPGATVGDGQVDADDVADLDAGLPGDEDRLVARVEDLHP